MVTMPYSCHVGRKIHRLSTLQLDETPRERELISLNVYSNDKRGICYMLDAREPTQCRSAATLQ